MSSSDLINSQQQVSGFAEGFAAVLFTQYMTWTNQERYYYDSGTSGVQCAEIARLWEAQGRPLSYRRIMALLQEDDNGDGEEV